MTGNKEDLGVMQDYLQAIVEYVQKSVEQGKSKEEITQIKVLDGFENFLYADFWTLKSHNPDMPKEKTSDFKKQSDDEPRRCAYCGSESPLVWVHGHGQCANCGINVQECCQGETCQMD